MGKLVIVGILVLGLAAPAGAILENKFEFAWKGAKYPVEEVK